MRKILLLVMAIPFLVGNTYYVDNTTGSDSNSGLTQNLAWKTICKVSGNISAGDSILFNSSTFWNLSKAMDMNGTLGAYITFDSYGIGNKPVFDINNSAFSALTLRNNSYIQINNISFSGGNATSMLLNLENVTNVRISNCYFNSSIPYYAIQLYGGCAKVIIDNNTFENVGERDAIRFWVKQSSPMVSDILFHNNTFDTILGSAVRIYFDSPVGASPLRPTYFNLTNNTINNTIGYAFDCGGAQWSLVSGNIISFIGNDSTPNINGLQLNDFDNGVVENNIIHDVITSVPDGVGIILDWAETNDTFLSDNNIVRKNTIYNCTSGSSGGGISAYKSTNSTIENNLIYNCARGIAIANPQTINTTIQFNTIVNSTICIKVLQNTTYPHIVRNNIFSNSQYGISVQHITALPIEYNNVFYNMTIFPFYNTTPAQDIALNTTSLISDPLLTSDYKLKFGSPAIGAGVDVGVKDDYRGIPRPIGGSYDIGAFEYGTIVRNATIRSVTFN